MKTTARLSDADLWQYHGSECWYRHALNRHVLFTEGAKHVADEGHAYWLLDEIALAQRYDKRVSGQPFQVWRLNVNPDHTGVITVEDGSYNLLLTKQLEFTDFPIPEITLWFANNVIYLPSEH